jgi:hypothetical protein
MVTKVQNGRQIQKSSDLGEIWFPSRLWCCELIFMVGLLWCSELDETFQKFCLTCVHIILRLRNFRVARCHKKREKFKVLGIGWNLIEMLYGMCINGKNTQLNTKVKNNHIFSDLVCK